MQNSQGAPGPVAARVHMFLSHRTCHTESCILGRRRGDSASGHMRSLPLSEKENVLPSKGSREKNCSHDPDSRRLENEYALLKIRQHMPAHMGLRFKVTLLSGLGNVHQEVDLKGYQIYKIPHVAWSTSSFWGGGGGRRSM